MSCDAKSFGSHFSPLNFAFGTCFCHPERSEGSVGPVSYTHLDVYKRQTVDWLEVDLEHLQGKVIRIPQREEIDVPVEEHLIVELYSR